MSDWLKLMLEEIDRKEAEEKAALEEAEKRRREKSPEKAEPSKVQDQGQLPGDRDTAKRTG